MLQRDINKFVEEWGINFILDVRRAKGGVASLALIFFSVFFETPKKLFYFFDMVYGFFS